MRVLLVTPDYPPSIGGIQLLLSRLVKHSRHQFKVLTLVQGAPDGRAAVGGQDSSAVGIGAGPRKVAVPLLNARALLEAKTWRPQAVVSGHVVTGPGALAAARMLKVPGIQYLHGTEVTDRPWLTRSVTRGADALVTVSAFTRAQAIKAGAPAERIHVISPGVDQPDKPNPGTTHAAHDRSTILTVARLEDHYKGFDVLVAALPLVRAKVPNVHWVLVGDGSLRPEIEKRVNAVGASDAVTFTGSVNDIERDQWLMRADVLVMPSRLIGGRGGEGFGIVFLEAAAHGVPSVAGNLDGAAEAVIDGQTGLTVDPTDHVVVAEAIATLLQDRALRERLGAAAREHARACSWGAMASRVDELLERLQSHAERAGACSASNPGDLHR